MCRGYTDGKPNIQWNAKKLRKGNKYSAVFDFVYFKELDEIVYMVSYGFPNETVGLEAMDDVEGRAEAAASEIVVKYAYLVSTVEGEDRAVYDVFTDVLTDTDYYTNVGDIDPSSAGKLEGKVSIVITIITNIGIIFSVLMPAVIGIKYMLGSVEEKAEYKKDMIPYLVGAALLFGICTLVKILQTIGNTINNI